jgi:Cu/Ag efflux protein CusF
MKSSFAFALILSLGAIAPAVSAADAPSAPHAGHMAAAETTGAADADAVTEGEVKKVDKAAAKITIKHGPLKNLGMPGMTMIFRVKDKTMLDQVKAGDKVRFVAEKIDGKFTVTQLDAAQ